MSDKKPSVLGTLLDAVKAMERDDPEPTCPLPWHQFKFMSPRCICGEKKYGEKL